MYLYNHVIGSDNGTNVIYECCFIITNIYVWAIKILGRALIYFYFFVVLFVFFLILFYFWLFFRPGPRFICVIISMQIFRISLLWQTSPPRPRRLYLFLFYFILFSLFFYFPLSLVKIWPLYYRLDVALRNELLFLPESATGKVCVLMVSHHLRTIA